MNRIIKGALVAVGLVVGGATVGLASESCVHEDGSGQASCHWDASTQGNGLGNDVYHIQGTPVYGQEAAAWALFDSTNAWSLLPSAQSTVWYSGHSTTPFVPTDYSITVWDGMGNHYLFNFTR